MSMHQKNNSNHRLGQRNGNGELNPLEQMEKDREDLVKKCIADKMKGQEIFDLLIQQHGVGNNEAILLLGRGGFDVEAGFGVQVSDIPWYDPNFKT